MSWREVIPAAIGVVVCILHSTSHAEPLTKKLLTRLAEEASVFEQAAPNLLTEETLQQRAVKPEKRRFRPFHPVPATPEPPEWQTREIRSEYAFAMVGSPPAIREIRKVTSVDGTAVETDERAVNALMRTLQATGDGARRKLLEDFEKYGLIGTVTDFGQLLLLFARDKQEMYAFDPQGERLSGAEQCLVFRYTQNDGAGALTVFEGKDEYRPRIAGEIWVDHESFRPVRITIRSVRGEGAKAVRDEAEVDYTMSPHGVLVPVSVVHREYRNGQLTAENRFHYAPFRKFGASAEIRFTEVPDQP